jgi:kanamycin kinase
LATGEVIRVVWSNEDAMTFEIGNGPRRRFMKWRPRDSRLDLTGEVQRLEWAGQYVSVPRVLSVGEDQEGRWFLSAPLTGESAVSPRWTRRPEVAVTAIGQGLRLMHDSLPVVSCPFSWSVQVRLAEIPDAADRQSLAEAPPVDRLVVCHGDACSPNTIIRDDGRLSGHVDLGSLGVADRWADLAVATMATTWNYGPGWEDRLLDAYGIAPDPVRTEYYRTLWNAAP